MSCVPPGNRAGTSAWKSETVRVQLERGEDFKPEVSEVWEEVDSSISGMSKQTEGGVRDLEGQ